MFFLLLNILFYRCLIKPYHTHIVTLTFRRVRPHSGWLFVSHGSFLFRKTRFMLNRLKSNIKTPFRVSLCSVIYIKYKASGKKTSWLVIYVFVKVIETTYRKQTKSASIKPALCGVNRLKAALKKRLTFYLEALSV